MTTTLSVAEAKARFSDLMARAVHRGERFLIARRGRPMVALVSAADLEKLEQAERSTEAGLEGKVSPPHMAMVGALADFPEYIEILEEIVRDRQKEMPRPFSFDDDE
ncbi:MAG: type II toxin-antitoxin system Phd/YefM family antitoxin [Chloroflexi bacterium]|nr:type II toxin-antitoxin system Phd/YefM family antitoxin [Chloroflexota bacterium]